MRSCRARSLRNGARSSRINKPPGDAKFPENSLCRSHLHFDPEGRLIPFGGKSESFDFPPDALTDVSVWPRLAGDQVCGTDVAGHAEIDF